VGAGLKFGFELHELGHGFGLSVRQWARSGIWSCSSTQSRAQQPSNERQAWNQGGDFFAPKLLLFQTKLIKFSQCLSILSLVVSLGELESILRNYKHGTDVG